MNISSEGRRDVFVTFVMPLFNAALQLLKFEPSRTHKQSLERVKKGIFKQFMGLSKRTNTVLVDDMLRMDLQKIANKEEEINTEKWNNVKKVYCTNQRERFVLLTQ